MVWLRIMLSTFYTQFKMFTVICKKHCFLYLFDCCYWTGDYTELLKKASVVSKVYFFTVPCAAYFFTLHNSLSTQLSLPLLSCAQAKQTELNRLQWHSDAQQGAALQFKLSPYVSLIRAQLCGYSVRRKKLAEAQWQLPMNGVCIEQFSN